MSRYTGARLRVIRRLGRLPGLTQKEPQSWNLPGQHGGTGKRKESQYACRLKEKQKLRYHYGVSEKQLVNYVRKAKKNKLATGDNLIKMLEMRLDNIIFRFGLVSTVPAARQLVSHKHVVVNQKVMSYPGYRVKPSDSVGVRRSHPLVGSMVAFNSDTPWYCQSNQSSGNSTPPVLSKESDNVPFFEIGTVFGEARPEDVPFALDIRLVIEYYARKI